MDSPVVETLAFKKLIVGIEVLQFEDDP